MRWIRVVVLSFMFVTLRAPVQAQTVEKPQPAPDAQAPKEPPPPLFPKHRRGIYKNQEGIEVVDGTPQSPPLNIDDPNVPDKGEWEVNLTTLGDRSKETQRVDLLILDVNYGIVPKIAGHEWPAQLKLELPLSASRTTGNPFTVGLGAAKAGVKLNVYTNEHIGLSLSIYPQVQFLAPGSDAVEKDLSEPGQVLVLPILLSKEFHDVTFVANGGLEQPVHNPSDDLRATFGVAIGRAITRRFAAMAEVGGDSTFAATGDRPLFFSVGVIRGVGHIVMYANAGHEFASGDDLPHTFAGVGVKLLTERASAHP